MVLRYRLFTLADIFDGYKDPVVVLRLLQPSLDSRKDVYTYGVISSYVYEFRVHQSGDGFLFSFDSWSYYIADQDSLEKGFVFLSRTFEWFPVDDDFGSFQSFAWRHVAKVKLQSALVVAEFLVQWTFWKRKLRVIGRIK